MDEDGTGTGWSSSNLFRDWMLNVFIKQEKPKERGGVVLFIDGSKTHLLADVVREARTNGIRLVLFPSHQTDVVQPLDVAVFKALKSYERTKQQTWMRAQQAAGLSQVLTPALFVQFVTEAWLMAAAPQTILNVLRWCGLYPYFSFNGGISGMNK